MPARKQLTETLVRSMPSRKQLTETPDCSTAPRTSAYGDARLLNGAEHRGCWGLLKANPRRIPHPCPRSQRKAGKGVFSLHLARKHPNAPCDKTTPPPSPKQGAGGAAPAGEQSITPRPNGCRGYDRAMTALDWAMTALDRASQRSHPHAPPPPPRGASVPARVLGRRLGRGCYPSP